MRLRSLLPILTLVGFIVGTEADAQLLYAGGEDIDFLCNSGGGCVSSLGGAFRTGWARTAYMVAGSSTDPATNRFATPTFSPNSALWIHAQFCNTATNNLANGCGSVGVGTTANAQMLRILDSSGNPTLIVRGTGNPQQVKISSRTAAGVFTDLVTCSSAFNLSLTQLDLYINYGTSGEVTLYNNSAQVCDYTGNVTNGDGATTLNQVEFGGLISVGYGAWSEVIIAGSDTRAMARFTANTVGNGNTTGFSGTNVCSAIWSAVSFNDTSYGFSGSTNVLHECTINSSIPAGSYNVLALVMSARALVGSSGPLHLDFVTRIGGTDYTSSDFAPTTSFSNIANYIQTVNPASSSPWIVSDFQATGFNVGEKTKP
ncbi:MAG: hypothetical protein J0H44_14295 [Alphaproteobacteria bacterium]|nr:hypothetical protein [Alphaproteobacteria bacterium]